MPLTEPAGAILVPFGELCLYVGLDEVVIAGPGPDPGARLLPPDAEAIRQHVRFDDAGAYRPLSGLRNLPTNWQARFATLEDFSRALDAVYPLAQRHVSAHADGCLEVTSLDSVFARQEGRYAVSANLSPRGRSLAQRALCGGCVRVPFWAGDNRLPESGIPCPEPCSLMLSLCREMAIWEAEPAAVTPPDASVPFAAFDQPGNPLREAVLRAMEPVRDQ